MLKNKLECTLSKLLSIRVSRILRKCNFLLIIAICRLSVERTEAEAEQELKKSKTLKNNKDDKNP